MLVENLDLSLDGEEVKFICYTGMAASILNKKGLFATTIHKLIYDVNIKEEKNKKGIVRDNLHFILKKHLSEEIKLLVIDEVSMVDEKIYEDLLTFNIPIVMIGDSFQLQPPTSNKGIGYLLESPDVLLDEPLRQALENPIIQLATDIRNFKQFEYGNYGDNLEIIRKEDICDDYLDEADQILAAKNVTVMNINTYYRKAILGKMSPFPSNGEKVICLKNNWNVSATENHTQQFLVNGLIGNITMVKKLINKSQYSKFNFKPDFFEENEFREVSFDNIYFEENLRNEDMFYEDYEKYKTILYSRKRLTKLGIQINKFNYGYCMTVYKSQGSEFGSVLYIDDMLSRQTYQNHLYTAVTRAKEKLVLAI